MQDGLVALVCSIKVIPLPCAEAPFSAESETSQSANVFIHVHNTLKCKYFELVLICQTDLNWSNSTSSVVGYCVCEFKQVKRETDKKKMRCDESFLNIYLSAELVNIWKPIGEKSQLSCKCGLISLVQRQCLFGGDPQSSNEFS